MEPNYNPFEPSSENESTNINQNFNPDFNNNYQQKPRVIRLNMFEAASMVLAIGALVSCTCFYGAYIMGALAILFALLSRGGQMKMSSKARFGLILGIFAILLTTIITVTSVYIAIEEFGSIENVLREYCEMYGIDFEQEFGPLFEELQ